jgi:hypothetical protein
LAARVEGEALGLEAVRVADRGVRISASAVERFIEARTERRGARR